MKKIGYIILLTGIFACNVQSDKVQTLQQRVDSLDGKLAHAYKPGFGEFMSSIQVHHNKLWFAGKNENWALADFEVHEIMEALDAIQHYLPERSESQLIGMITPALDTMNAAIQQKRPERFSKAFALLTKTCNDCHSATKFEFNVVKTPDVPPFSNQDFRYRREK